MSSKSSKQRQFKGTTKPRLFFDRKIRPSGNTKVVSLGKILPISWYFTRMEVVDRDANSVTVKFTKLLEMSQDASDTTANTGSEQNS